MNMVSTLVMAVQAFKKNVAKQVAVMSGGEYTTFTRRQDDLRRGCWRRRKMRAIDI